MDRLRKWFGRTEGEGSSRAGPPASATDQDMPSFPGLPSLPAPPTAGAAPLEPAQQLQSPLFRLAPEIRDFILRAAFGDGTIHIDLRLGYPRRMRDLRRRVNKPVHGGYPPLANPHDTGVPLPERRPADRVVGWRWYSCVCHRSPRDPPARDRCLRGVADCASWPGPAAVPDKCMVGAMGLLVSCKRAYHEVSWVLYATNAIFMESHPLIEGILRQDLVPGAHRLMGPNLRLVTALHLRWDYGLIGSYSGGVPSHRALLAENLELLPCAFPGLRELALLFGANLYKQRYPCPRANMAELEAALFGPLLRARVRMAAVKEFGVGIPYNVLWDLMRLSAATEDEVRAMSEERGGPGMHIWYPFSDAPEERGRPGRGFFIKGSGETGYLLWTKHGQPLNPRSLGPSAWPWMSTSAEPYRGPE